MDAVYLESSALVAWLLAEDGAEEIASRIDEAPIVTTSSLTIVETRRALLRLERDGALDAASGRSALGKLERARTGWTVFVISPAIEERAGSPFPREPIRTLDAIHLATALECARAYDDLLLLSLDRRILENAEALGFAQPEAST